MLGLADAHPPRGRSFDLSLIDGRGEGPYSWATPVRRHTWGRGTTGVGSLRLPVRWEERGGRECP